MRLTPCWFFRFFDVWGRHDGQAGALEAAEDDGPVTAHAVVVHGVAACDGLAVVAAEDPDASGGSAEGSADGVDAGGQDEEVVVTHGSAQPFGSGIDKTSGGVIGLSFAGILLKKQGGSTS